MSFTKTSLTKPRQRQSTSPRTADTWWRILVTSMDLQVAQGNGREVFRRWLRVPV
nr:MAG TPA: hypothetical protein [Caudoviricetes sp.]